VSPAEKLLAEALRQTVLLDQCVWHEPPPDLREEPLELLVVRGHRDELPAGEQEPGGDEAVDVWIPLDLTS